jgi:hypothetical protein
MTDDDRKLLTEKLLGEEWHEWFDDGGKHFSEWRSYTCGICGKNVESPVEPANRTFLTWQDVGDVKDKLVEKGMWREFENHAYSLGGYEGPAAMSDIIDGKYVVYYPSEFTVWLFRPVNEKGEAHFCQLAVDFLMEVDK